MESKKWHVLHNGEIIYSGTETQCSKLIEKDTTGELEMYPESGRIVK